MITKKTVVEGRALTQAFTSPLAFLHDFFETKPGEPKIVRRYTEEHRTMVKKRVAEGRKTDWGSIQPIREKRIQRSGNKTWY